MFRQNPNRQRGRTYSLVYASGDDPFASAVLDFCELVSSPLVVGTEGQHRISTGIARGYVMKNSLSIRRFVLAADRSQPKML
jgi:hypothetical protein